MHAIEKILANHSGKRSVRAGEIVNCEIDLAEVNDLYLQVIKSFHEMGGISVKYPERIAFVLDHYAPAPTIQSASNQKAMREFVQEQGIPHLFDVNKGVCHQVMPEAGLVWPGMLLVATDSHTTTHGAFGALGTGVGATDLASILLTGELWLRVPEIISIQVDGSPGPGVTAKDIILHIIGTLKQDVAVYKGIEYKGAAVEQLSLAGRMVLCNMAVEMGAKTAYIVPDHKVIDYIKVRHAGPRSRSQIDLKSGPLFITDSGFKYAHEYVFNVNDLEPQAAVPHSVDNVVAVSEIAGKPVNQVFIGSCTNGRLEDIEIAASILSGKKVHPDCRMIIIPASDQVFLQALRAGYVEALTVAGAVFSSPGCGPCLGAHQGVVAPGEVCVTTSSRNFPGRMGSTEAELYSASPATAAASALTGRITDPRPHLPGGIRK